MLPHIADELQSPLFRHLEMGRTGHSIEGMEIVRQHSRLQQRLREGQLRFFIVIDPFQQYGLIQQRDSET